MLGDLTGQERYDYTLSVKGHIALARARFPEGITGTQLDTLARAPIWHEGLDYRCGTGHGVGLCLSVHEGPVGFRVNYNPLPCLLYTSPPLAAAWAACGRCAGR